MSKQFYFKQFSLVKQFYFNQCSISAQFSSIWPKGTTLSGATYLDQSRPGSDGNKGVCCIPLSSSIIGTSSSDCIASYLGHSLWKGLTPVQRSSRCILQPQPTRPHDTRCRGEVLPHRRDAIGVFSSPSN